MCLQLRRDRIEHDIKLPMYATASIHVSISFQNKKVINSSLIIKYKCIMIKEQLDYIRALFLLCMKCRKGRK